MYILDTDTLSFSLYRSDEFPHLIRKIEETDPGEMWISVVTAEELIAWGFNQVRNSRKQKFPHIIRVYQILFDRINDLKELQILPFDEAAYREFIAIPAEVQKVIGTNDRRIAATALSRGFTVVTHNVQHFSLVPRLRVEDWAAAPLI